MAANKATSPAPNSTAAIPVRVDDFTGIQLLSPGVQIIARMPCVDQYDGTRRFYKSQSPPEPGGVS
jgi:hypothetical protein